MILFKAKFKDAILNGSKTTTLRAWKRRLAKPKTIASTNLGIKLYVHEVSEISLNALTDEHAIADGFESRDAMIVELRAIYPTLPQTLTLIRFSLAST